jgi:hypothetical protein
MSVECAISHKIPNIQISTIENIVKLNVLLNSDTYNRYLTVLCKLYKVIQEEISVFSEVIVTVIIKKKVVVMNINFESLQRQS